MCDWVCVNKRAFVCVGDKEREREIGSAYVGVCMCVSILK